MSGQILSRWARVARRLGLGWLAAAVAVAACDYAFANGPRDPHAMFGGHALALGGLIVGAWLTGAVALCVAAAGVQAYRRPPVRAGWRACGVGLAAALGGCGLLFWSFVQ